MKTPILVLALVLSFGAACKSKKEAAVSSTKENTASIPKINGKVSHQYRAGGCATVIIIPASGGVNEITLIPKDKLAKEFDVDGMQISFNYQTLRMPQPDGCTVGMPADIKDVSKK